MDFMMPGMDGVEAMCHLKAAGGFDTPVFALTANVVAGTQGKLLSAGFKKYISKPIRWRDLESALLEVLPKGRVLAGKNIGCIPIEEKSRLSRELSNSGIILEDGLHYVDGDIIKYGKSALIFTENYCMDMDNARNLAGQEDWHSLKFCVHSLKSNAKNLGANVLSETALKIEQLCDSGDGGYISAILPKLYYEWAMVSNSLMSFNGRLINILPKPEKEPVSANEISGLLKFLKLNQYQNAMDTLENLIEAEGGPERLEKLYGVQKKISGLQFREAEQLLIGILESEV
jgi:HPt (histidine-containing phosphotransfer) domain-containing protein